MADDTISGVPQIITMSGLQSAPGSFSGASQGTPTGGISGTQPGVTPGIEGGPGLDLLSMLLQQAGSGTGDAGVGALTPFTQQSLGQTTGGLTAGSFGQGGGQGLIAGAMGTGAGAQQQTGAGSIDPLSIIQKLLGLGSKASGLLGAGTSSPTLGDTGGTSLSDQVRSGQGGASPAPTASPQPGVLTLGGQAFTASPTAGDPNAPGVPPGFGDPNALGALPGAPTGGQDLSLTNTLGQSTVDPQRAEALQSLLGAGFTPDQIQGMLGSTNPAAGFSAGEIPGGGASVPSGLSGSPTASPTSLGGAVQGGLTGLGGLLNIIQGIQGGNVQQGIGGALQGTGGIAKLLQSYPDLAQALGLGDVAGSTFSGIGGVTGGLGGLLGIAGGIQGLINGGSPASSITQLGSGALGTAQGLEAFVAAFPELAQSIGLGTAAAATGPAAAAAGEAALAAGTEAGTGIAGAIAPILAEVNPYTAVLAAALGGPMVASLLGSIQDMESGGKLAGVGTALKRMESQIPGLENQLFGVTKSAQGIGGNTSAQDALNYLQQANTFQSGFQGSGVENLLKAGVTGTAGDWAIPSSMFSAGTAGNISFLPQAQQLTKVFGPQLEQMDLGRLRAEDILGKAGYTPDQIAAQTGRYVDPIEFALTLNAAGPSDNGLLAGAAGPIRQALQQNVAGDWGPYTSNTAPGEITGRGGAAGFQNLNFGFNNIPLLSQLEQLAPGGMEQGLSNLLQQYGGTPAFSGLMAPSIPYTGPQWTPPITTPVLSNLGYDPGQAAGTA